MRTRNRALKTDKDDLRTLQRFRGTLSNGEHSMPVRFTTHIGEDGEVRLDLHAFRITKTSRFVHECRNTDRRKFTKFGLHGISQNGLCFDSDELFFTSPEERWSGVDSQHWSKPIGQFSKAQFTQKVEAPAERTVLKLHLKGFACFPIHAECPLGSVSVAGANHLVGEVNRLTGYIAIEAHTPPADGTIWRAEAYRLVEHIRRLLSFASSAALRGPILEFMHKDCVEVEVFSQTRQYPPTTRVFHPLDQQGILDAAIASFFEPKIDAKNLFFAIEWFTMAATYNEVRLISAMTALENILDSNLAEEERIIEPTRAFDKTRKALRKVIRNCLAKWPAEGVEAAQDELCDKLLDLNRRTLRRKLHLLADRWQVPLDGITDAHISRVIRARNAIVHTGYKPLVADDLNLWDDVTIARELVVRFLLTAFSYRGSYISQMGGYHSAIFPPEPGARDQTAT